MIVRWHRIDREPRPLAGCFRNFGQRAHYLSVEYNHVKSVDPSPLPIGCRQTFLSDWGQLALKILMCRCTLLARLWTKTCQTFAKSRLEIQNCFWLTERKEVNFIFFVNLRNWQSNRYFTMVSRNFEVNRYGKIRVWEGCLGGRGNCPSIVQICRHCYM